MKTILLIVVVCFALICNGQQKRYSFYQLYQLDSIGRAPGIASYFGGLYYEFLLLVENKLKRADTSTARLVRHFEEVFAQFYIDAAIAHREHRQIPLPAWRFYFTDTTLSPAQYYLLGANAHLNGGLSEAIAGSYTPAEWKYLKKKYKLFNQCLNTTFRKVYKETLRYSAKARLLSWLTFGFTKPAGNFYLYKWRKRQMRLTEAWFLHDPKYSRLAEKVKRKKDRIDKLVVKRVI